MDARPINEQRAESAPSTTSSRRRLIKKAPPGRHLSVASTDDPPPPRLGRTPSAKSRSRHSVQAPSPTAATHPAILDARLTADSAAHGAHTRSPRFSVADADTAEFLGQRFDSAAVLSSFNAVPYSADPRAVPPPPQAAAASQHSSGVSSARQSTHVSAAHANTAGNSLNPANPAVRLDHSLAATGRKMDDAGGTRGLRNRLSDEVKEKDSKMFKKKSGLSSFFNLSSPRRPPISAPENPVHVTHVGYDQETGEFTVCFVDCETREMRAWMAFWLSQLQTMPM